MPPQPGPPRIFERLLELAVPGGIVREDVVGSMAEEFSLLATRRGLRRARRWYRRQAVGIAIRALASRFGRRAYNPTGPASPHYAQPGGSVSFRQFVTDFRYAARSFRSTPGLVAAALLTLATGIGANTAMFSFVSGILLTPLGYPDRDRMVSIWPEKRLSAAMGLELVEHTESFDAISLFTGAGYTLIGDAEPEVLSAAMVGADHFRVVGIQPMLGRPFFAEDALGANGPVVILGHDLWTRRFGGDSTIVGRTIALSGNGSERHRVVGVLPADFPSWWVGTRVWVPMIMDENATGFYRSYGASAMARLKPGVTVETASQEVARLVPSFAERHPTQFRTARFSPVDVLPLQEITTRDVRGRLLLMLGAVGMVLLIACTNVANLLLARATGRQREIGLRMALGAGRWRVAQLALTESLTLALVGGTIGTGVAALTLPIMITQIGSRLPRTAFVELDLTVLGFALASSLFAGLLFGVGPALRAAAQHPLDAMGGQARGSGTGRRAVRVNDALVVAEVALSMVLVLGAGLMLKSLWLLAAVDPGFDGTRTQTMRLVLPAGRYDSLPARAAFFGDLTERLRAISGVEQVAWTNYLPLFGGSAGIPYLIEGQDLPEGTNSVVSNYKTVSPEFFDVMQMPLLRGRWFGPQDQDGAETVVLINETMARRHWPNGDPLGANLLSTRSGNPFARIVGVVGDIRQNGLSSAPAPEFYFSGRQDDLDYRYLLLRAAAQPTSVVEPARTIIRALDSDIPILDVQSMAEVIDDNLGSSRFYVRLFGTFAVMALLLGVVGVYGVMAYAVSRRTREIGVRIALGATKSVIVRSTMYRGMVVVLAGIGLGLVAAVVTSRLLTGLLYEVQPTDPWVYGTVALILTGAGALANAVPAWRATRMDPIGALRLE